jgi:hypothetical protein
MASGGTESGGIDSAEVAGVGEAPMGVVSAVLAAIPGAIPAVAFGARQTCSSCPGGGIRLQPESAAATSWADLATGFGTELDVAAVVVVGAAATSAAVAVADRVTCCAAADVVVD